MERWNGKVGCGKFNFSATLYTELEKQCEIVKIEEIKNIPIINVLDPARAAARKDKPRKATIAAITFLLSLITAVGYVFVDHQYRQQIIEFMKRLRSVSGMSG